MLPLIPTLQKALTTVQTTDRRDQVSCPQVDDLGFFMSTFVWVSIYPVMTLRSSSHDICYSSRSDHLLPCLLQS